MLFHKKHQSNEDNKQKREPDLYPVHYVMDSLKQYHTDLVQKEVESLSELSLVGSSFNSVIGEAEQFQRRLEDLEQNFYRVYEA